MTSEIPTPRTDAECFTSYDGSDIDGWKSQSAVPADFARLLERENAVAMERLALWRDRAFDWNNSEEFVEIDNLIGELKAMRRAYEEGK